MNIIIKLLTLFCLLDAFSIVFIIIIGEQVLENFSFDSTTTRLPVFGLAMLLIAYLVISYLFLLKSKLHYLTVGHTGAQAKKILSKSAVPAGPAAV